MLSLRQKYDKIIFEVLVLAVLAFLIYPAAGALPGTETRISYSTDCQNIRPSIGDNWIVWEEHCSGQDRILAYNYMTGVQLALPNTTLSSHAPKIRGTLVTWYESPGGTHSNIYYSDLSSLPPVAHVLDVPVSEKKNPGINGDAIIWEEIHTPDMTTDIMLYNITTSTFYNLTPGTDASNQRYPSIGGRRVIWQDDRDGEEDLYYNDTSDWSLHSIPDAPPAGVMYMQPVTDGSSVVWYDGSTYDILMSDFSVTSTIDNNGNPKFNPSVCSTFVVWKEDLSGSGFGPYDIVLYNTATATKEVLTDSAAPENAAMVDPDPDLAPVSINGDSRIVWVDDRTGYQDIYMFTYGPVTDCPIVNFSEDKTEGNPPLTVRFTDTSLNVPAIRYWDFGDGKFSSGNPVSHTFGFNGLYKVKLTAATPYCRNTTTDANARIISVGVPLVGFSANITEAIAPVAIAFRGTGTNTPIGWAWTFGDGTTSTFQNPVHTYAAGKYSVILEVRNLIGNGTKKRMDYITALNGMQSLAGLTIPGISISGSGTGQVLTLNTTLIPSYALSPDKKTLAVYPPTGYGWQNISFFSSDTTTFSETLPLISGRFSTVIFTTNDSLPAIFSGDVGNNLRLNYQYLAGHYDRQGVLTTQVWEGVSPTDDPDFGSIISHSQFSDRTFAYTVIVSRNAITTPASARLNLSVSSGWETGTGDIASERLRTYVIAKGYNANGNRVGTVLPAVYVRNDTTNHIEYFLADIPPQYAFLDRFALAKLGGTGNPFQLITLTVASHVDPPENPAPDNPTTGTENSASTVAGGKTALVQAEQVNPDIKPPAEPPDPGKTAALYTNPDGIITQETSLKSTDGLAIVTVGLGITAHDRTGSPVPSISIASLPRSEVPPLPDSRVVSFGGRAYELRPDGAIFSPGLSLSFIIPQAQWGREYSIRTFDHATGTWQELPGRYDAKTGTITAIVSHFCCFALFEKEIAQSDVAARETPTSVITAVTPAQPPSTAISVFFGMVLWIAETAVKYSGFIAIVAIACALVYAGRVVHRKRRGH